MHASLAVMVVGRLDANKNHWLSVGVDWHLLARDKHLSIASKQQSILFKIRKPIYHKGDCVTCCLIFFSCSSYCP